MFKTLEFDEIRDDERILEEIIKEKILSDEWVISEIEYYHNLGDKCAAITVYENNLLDGFVAPESDIKKLFDFPNLKFAFEFYDIEDSICSIFVRDGRVSISVISVIGVSGEMGIL